MKVYDLPRFEGKTTALVKLMLGRENEDVIYVAPTNSQCEAAWRIARELCEDNPPLRTRFQTPGTVAYAIRTNDRRWRYVFDEFDGVAEFLLGGPVLAIALTSEDKK